MAQPKRRILLRPEKVSEQLLAQLEDQGLISRLMPTPACLNAPDGKSVDETIYISDPKWGSHKLICVGKNSAEVCLSSHPDNEEVILINQEPEELKPMYFIMGLHPADRLEGLAREGKLSSQDFLSFEARYNDPNLSFFIVLAEAPHCEITMPAPGIVPTFFVTEPSQMGARVVDLGEYELQVSA